MRRNIIFNYFYAFGIFGVVCSMKCEKDFFYHQYYGYGYKILCNKLDSESVRELEVTNLSNEIKLTITSSNLTAGDWEFFQALVKLREISILNSTLNYSNQPLFKEMNNLNYLVIENNNVVAIFNNTFKKLVNLKELSLSNNSLTYIPPNALDNLIQLICLHLNRNSFKTLSDIPLCEVPNLKRLYLQYNYITLLPHNTTCISHLEELYLDYNIIDSLGKSLLTFLNLKVLSLSYNKIHNLDNFISNLKALTHLDLEGNHINVLNNENFENLISLQYINLKNNQIQNVSENAFHNNLKLSQINLEHNSIHRINLDRQVALEYLILAKNKISSLQLISLLKNLTFLDISHNNITEVSSYVFKNLTSLRYLNLSNNNINNNIGKESFFGLLHISELYLQNINISYFDGNIFTAMNKLEILDLSQNKILNLNNASFARLPYLKFLNISHNYLESLEHNVLKQLMFLKILDVSGNLLQNIEYDIIIPELPSLRTINIKENLLTCEFLSKMIEYLKNNDISYTIHEEFKYDRENVAGIYCQETEKKLKQSLDNTNEVLKNNVAVLKTLVNLTVTNNQYERTLSQNIFYAVTFILLGFGVFTTASYRMYLYYKRHRDISEDLELIPRH